MRNAVSVLFVCFCCLLLFDFSDCKESRSLIASRVNGRKKPKNSSAAFERFKAKYSKEYESADRLAKAQENYVKNIARIRAHNEDKSSSYVQGENLMTDLSYEEVVKRRTGHLRHLQNETNHIRSMKQVNVANIVSDQQKGQSNPNKKKKTTTRQTTRSTTKKIKKSKKAAARKVKSNSVGSLDLRNDFPPVQYQSDCGSCWSFTATALVDNFSYKQGMKTKYSEQYLLDCSNAGRWVQIQSTSRVNILRT